MPIVKQLYYIYMAIGYVAIINASRHLNTYRQY